MLDYVENHPEEKRFWVDRVVRAATNERDHHAAAGWLAEELRRYCEERAAVTSPFREWREAGGIPASSLRNLAEYWLRLWVVPRARNSSAVTTYDGIRIKR